MVNGTNGGRSKRIFGKTEANDQGRVARDLIQNGDWGGRVLVTLGYSGVFGGGHFDDPLVGLEMDSDLPVEELVKVGSNFFH